MPRHARPDVPRAALEDVLAALRVEKSADPPAGREARDEARMLYLSDPWPWTTGTPAAVSEMRPLWAAAAVPLDQVRALSGTTWELVVRELNRALDPGPFGRRAPRW